jgi:hypothetical protein
VINNEQAMKITLQKGDTIRAYDFKPMLGREDTFIEGQVLETNNMEMGYQSYKILVTNDSWREDESDKGRIGIEMFVPWRTSFNDFPGRVMNLSR